MVIAVNSDYFLKRHLPDDLCHGEWWCSFRYGLHYWILFWRGSVSKGWNIIIWELGSVWGRNVSSLPSYIHHHHLYIAFQGRRAKSRILQRNILGMAVAGHADANRHALLNTRKLPVYSTCRLCQQAQTLSLLVVVQGQCTMGCAADESGMEGGFSAL
jgi:hypothetical protein